MANPISSQITATALNQNRQTEQASRPSASSSNTADSRQEVATNQALPLGGADTQVVSEKVQLESAVSDINDYVQTVNRELQFRVDDALPLGRSVITVVDTDTQETIREFPSEQALSLARSLKEQSGEVSQDQIEGLIISAQA